VTTAAIVAAVVVVVAVAALITVGASKKTKSAAPAKTTTSTTAKPTGTSTKNTKITWVHKDLAGKVITVSAGTTGSARFVKIKSGTMLPAAVVAIDDAFTSKDVCAAGETLYKSWTTGSGSTQASRDRMSAYAAYALEKGKAQKCSWATG
jgi:glutamate 5-kinase